MEIKFNNIDKKKTKFIGVRFPMDLYNKIKEQSKKEDCTVSRYLLLILNHYINNIYEEKNGNIQNNKFD